MPSLRSLVRVGAFPLLLAAAGACALLGRSGQSLSQDMEEHYEQVGHVQAAIVRGDLDAARAPARWLAEHPEHPDVPQGVKSPMEDMRVHARSVVRAVDLTDAARATAEMAAACGRCHRLAGTGPDPATWTMAPPGQGAPGQMARHLWAVDRMWEGLVAPSDRLWQQGVTALIDDPLFQGGGAAGDADVARLAREVHDLGVTANGRDADGRAGVYGRLLTTCVTCHQKMGISM
jgi:cytochrome c553